jgi:hypothetical protein
MHVLINVKSPNNISKWQMGFNSAFKGLSEILSYKQRGLHVKWPLFLQILMKLEFSRQLNEKYSNIKFYENPSIGSRVVHCGWTGGQTDITKLIVAYRNFASAPKKKKMTVLPNKCDAKSQGTSVISRKHKRMHKIFKERYTLSVKLSNFTV